jgi:hypothetical protein
VTNLTITATTITFTRIAEGEKRMPEITKSEISEIRKTYKPHFIQIDSEVVTEDLNGCSKCDAMMRYEGYKGNGEYRAFAICTNPECDYAEDF